jgi:Spy/CpxP family protein refolding chaperone
MKNRIYLLTAILCSATFVVASTSYAQRAPAYAQKPTAISKAEAISQQLNLTPQEKVKVLPILRDELPKVKAIENDNSLTRMQKVQQIRAIHQQTDPQMKAILTPEQYEKLKAIRQHTIKEATETHGH